MTCYNTDYTGIVRSTNWNWNLILFRTFFNTLPAESAEPFLVCPNSASETDPPGPRQGTPFHLLFATPGIIAALRRI